VQKRHREEKALEMTAVARLEHDVGKAPQQLIVTMPHVAPTSRLARYSGLGSFNIAATNAFALVVARERQESLATPATRRKTATARKAWIEIAGEKADGEGDDLTSSGRHMV
jgi:hypothetical protein